MKQVLQNLRNGETTIEEVPSPAVTKTGLLIQTRASLISAGTEKMLVEFGKAGWIGKARAQPDKVRQVLDKIKTDGLMPTLEAVFSKLDEPLPLGYCNAGVVLEVGPEVTGFRPGDRVVSNGNHAELVSVPQMLCAKIPDGVSDEHAAFTVLAAIALQGIRLAAPTLGETVVVYGLGLIGLVTVQLLVANGCQVIGIDLSAERLRLAEAFGAKTVDAGGSGDVAATVQALTDGRGADAVLITAAARGDDIVHQSAEMSRKRGRIVLVGVVDLQLRRSDFFEKEITFQVSCSYGPGRYDETYELKGQDYPVGFVRWTEQRNFDAVLDMLRAGRLEPDALITHRVAIENAPDAYRTIQEDRSALGVILEYDADVSRPRSLEVTARESAPAGTPGIALIGAGNFAKAVIGPALKKTGARLVYVADLAKSASAGYAAKKFGFQYATTDVQAVWDDDQVDAVVIATQHDTHAELACRALQAGKHVFVEKPMALDVEQTRAVVDALSKAKDRQYMVGFNRRFSPHIRKVRELVSGRGEPLALHYAVNAGVIPPGIWVHDPKTGGGRIIGEGCHFIDVLRYVVGFPIVTVAAAWMGKGVAVQEDKMAIVLSFEDGSIGTVDYFGNGSKAYPKETMEVYGQGRVLRMENFRRTRGYGFSGFSTFKTKRQDKGHRAEFQAFVDQVDRGGEPLMPLGGIVNVTLATFAAMTSAREGRTVHLRDEYPDLASV